MRTTRPHCRFHHRPSPSQRADSKPGAAHHKADQAFDKIVQLLAAQCMLSEPKCGAAGTNR